MHFIRSCSTFALFWQAMVLTHAYYTHKPSRYKQRIQKLSHDRLISCAKQIFALIKLEEKIAVANIVPGPSPRDVASMCFDLFQVGSIFPKFPLLLWKFLVDFFLQKKMTFVDADQGVIHKASIKCIPRYELQCCSQMFEMFQMNDMYWQAQRNTVKSCLSVLVVLFPGFIISFNSVWYQYSPSNF